MLVLTLDRIDERRLICAEEMCGYIPIVNCSNGLSVERGGVHADLFSAKNDVILEML